MAEPTSKPAIMLLSLKREPHFDTMYSNLLAHLSTSATIKASNSASATLTHLAANQPSAILITDAALVGPSDDSAFAAVLSALAGYVRRGGTAVFCCHFASHAAPDALDGFFGAAFGLPWRRGEYYRTTFALNAAAAKHVVVGGGKAQQRQRRLAAAYSQKAVHLRDVANAQAVYLPTAESKLESLVFTAERIEDRAQTPVAWARVGEGWVGYVGDVDAEGESDEVVLAMCGL